MSVTFYSSKYQKMKMPNIFVAHVIEMRKHSAPPSREETNWEI
jgi:hypothetical protein